MNRSGMMMWTLASLATITAPAWGHAGHEHSEHAFLAGLTHPMLGLDHLLAMVAVGLLAVRSSHREALWLLPTVFVSMMVVGGLAALSGAPMPGVETGISMSVLLIGLAVAWLPGLTKSTMPAAAAVIGLFALAHGHAHIAEMSGNSAGGYLAGVAMGTALLHAAGILFGLWIGRIPGGPWVRLAGGAISVSFAIVLVTGL